MNIRQKSPKLFLYLSLIAAVSCGSNKSQEEQTTELIPDYADSLSGLEHNPYVEFDTIKSGSFTFGSPEDRPCRAPIIEIETPVTLTRSFLIATTEVTQAQWKALDLPNPSQNIGDDKPVTFVNFFEALVWCNKLSRLEGLETCYDLSSCENRVGTGCGPDEKWPEEGCLNSDINFTCAGDIHKYANFYECPGYRLPTTAEWEYAAKASTFKHTYGGDVHYVPLGSCEEEPALEDIAWYCNNSEDELHSVRQKQPNPWGLYDMLGNVYEWTDFWSDGQSLNGLNTSTETALIDPQGPKSGNSKDIRGGGFNATGCYVSPSYQTGARPIQKIFDTGFRPVRTLFDDDAESDSQK